MDTNIQRILLICSRRSGRERIAQPLGYTGFDCSRIHGAQEAVKELANAQYSAVIVHQDALGNGLADFCRQARSADHRLVIIASVSDHSESLELELFGCGVDDIVTDTHTPQALAKRIAVRLANRQRMN
jgi:DNA-binding response OmpR family regulator